MIGLLAMILSGAAWVVGAASQQNGDRPSLSASELKALRETNIFSPYRSRTYERPRTEERSRERERRPDPVPERPKPPIVTGIIFDEKTATHQVVVEDRNSERLKLFKEPKFLKAGDEVTGVKIQSVTAFKAVILHGEAEKDLKVGDSLPDTGAKALEGASSPSTTTPTTPAAEVKPLEEGVKNDVLEALKKRIKKKDRPSDEP